MSGTGDCPMCGRYHHAGEPRCSQAVDLSRTLPDPSANHQLEKLVAEAREWCEAEIITMKRREENDPSWMDKECVYVRRTLEKVLSLLDGKEPT